MGELREIVVHSWDELQSAVFDDVWDDKIMRYRDNCIYRGASDQQWDLVPSLNRVCAHDLSLESQVFRSFRKYGYAELAGYSGFWHLLPVAHPPGLTVTMAAGKQKVLSLRQFIRIRPERAKEE